MRSMALVAALALLCVSGTSSAAAPGRLEFELLRNGHPDGRHVITVASAAGGVSVRSQIDIAVRIGPITAYSFQQRCNESWSANALSALTCTTDKNGRRTNVSARRAGAALEVTGASGANAFPLTALPTSWWVRPPTNTRAMIDTQTGRPINVRVEHVGRETVQIAGRSVQADHIRVIGTLTADLWYDAQGRWIGCAFTMRGQRIQYRLVSPIDAAPAAAMAD